MEAKWDEWLKALDQLAAVSKDFLGTVQNLDSRLSSRKGICGNWSAKEVVAHIVGWEVEVADSFRAFRAGRAPDLDYDVNAFNRRSVDARKTSSWEAVLAELRSAQRSLAKTTKALSEKEIEMEPRFLTWANVLVRHYKHHKAQIEKLSG